MTSRNSNVELLRLLCIVMIVSMHVFGRYNDNLSVWGWAALSVNNAVGNLGVTIFMLISGWYGIRLRTEKLLNLWNITLFWSLALIAVDVDHSAKNLVRSVFPVFTGKYWFLTVYIVISCLSPYIERLIAQLSRRQFQQLIAVLLLFFVVAPTFVILEIMHDSGKGVMNMLTVYLIGRYMARYGLPTRLKGICGGGYAPSYSSVCCSRGLRRVLPCGHYLPASGTRQQHLHAVWCRHRVLHGRAAEAAHGGLDQPSGHLRLPHLHYPSFPV